MAEINVAESKYFMFIMRNAAKYRSLTGFFGLNLLEGYWWKINPQIGEAHDPTKNEMTPSDVTTGSGIKVWWQCEKGHEWQATIGNRSSGRGCPFCSGKRPSAENNLQILNPDLAKQWHPTKNGDLTPCDVTASSGKKVWWMCKREHEWEATINSRSSGCGCPYCSKRRSE